MKPEQWKRSLKGLAAAACLLVSACGTAGSPATSSSSASADAGAKWTVLIYMDGSNLEFSFGAASVNLEALGTAGQSEDVNFIIETGGSKEWKYEGADIAEDRLQRYRMDGGELSLIEEQPLANMGDPQTLESFLSWGVKQYPAERYMAVLWDHGGGAVGGAENDELYKSTLTTLEIAEAFQNVGTKFEIIGFDACLMSTMEVASVLSPSAHYLLASEEVEPGDGWDYATLGSTLVDQPDIDTEQFGRIVCNSYIANLEKNNQAEYSTMAMTNLDKIQDVVDAFSGMASAMSECISDTQKFKILSIELQQAKHYYAEEDCDLVDLARRAEILDRSITKKVIQAVQKAVVCTSCGSDFRYNNGLSVFFRLNASPSLYSTYATVCPSMEYLAFLDAVNYSWRAPSSVYEKISRAAEPVYADYHVDYEIVNDGDNPISGLRFHHGSDCLTSIDYLIYKADQSNHLYIMAKLPNLQADPDNITFHPYFDGMAATIGGVPCYLNLIEEQSDYSLFGIPVMIDNQELVLRVLWTPGSQAAEEDNSYEQNSAGTESDQASASPDAEMSASPDSEMSASPAAGASASSSAAAEASASPEPSATAAAEVTPLSDVQWYGATSTLSSGTFQILGIWDQYSSGNGLPGRNTISLSDGLELTIELPEADQSGKAKLMYPSSSIVYDSNTRVEMKPIDDGLYGISYTMKDALGVSYSSDIIPVVIRNGEFHTATMEEILGG